MPMEPLERLHRAVEKGDAAAVAACLAAGAAVDGVLPGESASPLLKACNVPLRADPSRYAQCVHLLLAAGADPNFQDWRHGWRPLHLAASTSAPAAVAALLLAGADAAATDRRRCRSVLHYAAARYDSCEQARLLIAAAPHTALTRSSSSGSGSDEQQLLGTCGGGQTPLQLALFLRSDTARPLLAEAPLPPPRAVLPALLHAGKWALPLYPIWVARQPLAAADWASIPHAVPGLGAALPAVLRRSEAEAAQLVRHLMAADRVRLCTAALCLARVEQCGQLPPLPTPLVQCILALCVA